MKTTAFIAALSLMSFAHAYEAKITKGQLQANLESMLTKASTDTGTTFEKDNFTLIEQRDLATSKFTMYVQTNSMIPVAKTAVRIWSDLKTNELVLAEMHLDEKTQNSEEALNAKFRKARFSPGAMKSKQLSQAINSLVEKEVMSHGTDARVISMKFKDQWENGDLVRQVEVRARRGVHTVAVSLLRNKIIRSDYMEFPQSERVSLKANVFPMYEEVEGTGEKLPFEVKELRYLDTHIHDAGNDPLSALGTTKFPESSYFPLLAETAVGEMYNLWSEASIRKKVEGIVGNLPIRANDFGSGLLLQGKYATINLHPAIKSVFKNVEFELKPTTHHMLSWVNVDGAWEARPVSGLAGKAITSQEDLLNRIPFRHPEHDTTSYINSGVDEAQVYYAVTALMESLVEMGFTDKGLSEKPFHAFLFDPDIGMRDNAYYYDNTINFTTYNPGSPNLARDNPTIWHELGHAIMERIMGTHLGFAGTTGGYGGLSEGMADFVASIVVEHQTEGVNFPGKENFRIINETGFYLTNEFHDEGEAYGGAMNDMLLTVISYEGKAGLHAFTDLTLEAMRLTRNHPALSAAGWYEHMLYADELGSAVRAPGKYKQLITDSLSARNFSFENDFAPAKMTVKFGETELTNASPASREKPLTDCGTDGVVAHDLKVSLTSGDSRFIDFPATVKVEYKKGALQGAINWIGEESNPQVYTINSEEEVLTLPLKASMECETVNQPDGSCKDYAYVQIFNEGSAKPVAKKRFYLKLNKAECK
jgi:hypothetical protein